MEGDLDKLAELVFQGNAKDKGSIQIQGDFETTIDLFEALLMCFTKGMRILFAINGVVPLGQLSNAQFNDFIEKFQAMGITPNVKKYHIYQLLKLQGAIISDDIKLQFDQVKDSYLDEIPLKTISDYKKIVSDNIADYYFQFQSEDNYYIIHFTLI